MKPLSLNPKQQEAVKAILREQFDEETDHAVRLNIMETALKMGLPVEFWEELKAKFLSTF